MCVTFKAVRIRSIFKQAEVKNHDGSPYRNPDYPVGTIICIDAKGNWYRYRDTIPDHRDGANVWPASTKRGIELYRDLWIHIGAYPGAPYFDAITASTFDQIKP